MPAPAAVTTPEPTAVDPAAMGHDMPMPQEPAQPMDHAAMGHEGMIMAPPEPIPPIPALTEADRIAAVPPPVRSAERRVGNECVSTWKSRWSPSPEKKTIKIH